MEVAFQDKVRYEFAAQFVQQPAAALFGAALHAHTLTITIDHPVVGRLLQRVAEGRCAVLPFIHGTTDAWLTAGATQRELDRTLAQVVRFVLPTYAEFAGGGTSPHRRAFDPSGNQLQQSGAALYDAGYYTWRSPAAYRDTILQRLDLWMALERQQPSLPSARRPTYRDLHDAFSAALAAAHWAEAAHGLQQMQQLNVSTADNLAFLQVQLLTHQQQWTTIWERIDYPILAKMRMPRAVRAALLTAFHHSVLLALEQDERWAEARDAFVEHRPRLGRLLTGRFDLMQGPVVHVFAYQAVVARDRPALDELLALDVPASTRRVLEHLRTLIPAPPSGSAPTAPDPLLRARLALANLDYDAALRVVDELADPVDRALLYVEIGVHSGDVLIAEQGLLAFWVLPEDTQAHLQASDQRLQFYLQLLERMTESRPKAGGAQGARIEDWPEWFAAMETDPDDPDLAKSLEHLVAVANDRSWTRARVQALIDRLSTFVLAPQLLTRPIGERALRYLIDLFLQDQEFPRDDAIYAELYETLYAGLLDRHTRNLTTSLSLLRLAAAIVQRSPEQCERIRDNLWHWFRQPVPALERCVLEAFDLCAEYGVAGGSLATWYREWVTALLALPGERDRIALETWLSFGTWVQPGNDLLQQLQERLARVVGADADNPVTGLPANYRITIFSLRPLSARRAREILLGRNPELDVRICMETDLNEQAKALARHSDMVVVVTTAITHALTYGIGPYVRDPIFANAAGSTSIIVAIEKRLKQSAGVAG